MTGCVTNYHAQAVDEYPLEYGGRHGLPPVQLIPCTLADDATNVTATRIRNSPSKRGSGSAFTFFMFPLDHLLPNLFLQAKTCYASH
jgi:hypothetical protein